MSKAGWIINRLMEMAMDTGEHPDFIHPEKKQKFADRTHSMAKNPAYPNFVPSPEQKEKNWEEVIGSAQYRDTLSRIRTFFNRLHGIEPGAEGDAPELELGTVTQAMHQAAKDAMAIERPYRRALEKLAIQLLFEQPEFASLKAPYEAGEFKIDAKLGVSGDLKNAKVAPAEDEVYLPDPDLELEAAEKLKGFDPEVEKRRLINAMIAGGAVSKNYAYQLFNTQLARISPGLPTLYGMAMAGTELGYFAAPDSLISAAVKVPGMAGGSAELEGGEEGSVPTIKVRAMIFPMLVQELAKGLLELVSYEGLPQDPAKAKEVIDKADLANEEAWAMIMGRGLWTRFVSAIGADADDVTLHLYNYLIQLEPAEFNRVMKTIQAGGPEATQLVKGLVAQLRRDIEDEKHGDYKETEAPPAEPEGGEFGYGGDAWRGQE